MNETETKNATENEIELAAGGLVWDYQMNPPCICIVRRGIHADWTLPKGRPEGDESLDLTAVREAMEETGDNVSLKEFAGTYTYTKEGHPKVVLIWHMTRLTDKYQNPAPSHEISERRWVPPTEALKTLTYPSEREFLARHTRRVADENVRLQKSKPETIRLAGAVKSLSERFNGYQTRGLSKTDGWWVSCVQRSVESALNGLKSNNVDTAWGAVHDAERFMVFAMSPVELVTKAASLSAETQGKLKGWRSSATKQLFAPIDIDQLMKGPASMSPEHRVLLQQVLVETLEVLHGYSDNTYHRMRLVGKQLNWLVIVCAILLTITFTLSYLYAPNLDLSFGNLISIALAGAFGGVVSAMYQLSRIGQAKIPEALLDGLITSGRPLVGAASALFLYAVLKSQIITLVDPSQITLVSGIVLGFVAGFSEQYVLGTVAKLAGSDEKAKTK
jgi:8-oxo-dGTP pyrophosphatase MutT (NUDIX family)